MDDQQEEAQALQAGDVGTLESLTSRGKEYLTLTPAPCRIALRDDTIKCGCSPGTTRLPKDLVLLPRGKQHAQWIHLPCTTFAASVSSANAERHKTWSMNGNAQDMQSVLTRLLGHTPNDKQQVLLKHFTSTFHCEGSCEGTKPISDFFVCKKCCAWQHMACQIFDDSRDRGGPVCNRCYQSFMLHRDEIIEWQRNRLLLAVREGFMYLNNPANRHQTWRREWLCRWLSRFFSKNQGVYQEYMAAKTKARRVAAARAYYSRVQTLSQAGSNHEIAQSDSNAAAENTNEHEEKNLGHSSGRRKQPERKKAPVKFVLEEDDEIEEDLDMDEAEEIAVAPRRRTAHDKNEKALRGIRAGKRKRASSSPSPVLEKSKAKTRAPRKSAPSTGWARPRDWADEGDQDDEEVGDSPLRRHTDRRANIKPQISCGCLNKPKSAADCFKCRDCHVRQHYDCADDVQDGLSVLCNFCFNRFSSAPMQLDGRQDSSTQLRPSEPQTQQMGQRSEQYDPALREEVNQLCATVLWREYSSIPSSNGEEPSKPLIGGAPVEWLSECQERLFELLSSAGREKTAAYLMPALASFPRQNDKIVKALRDLAVEEISRGSYRGKRKRLGIVLEVLGLEEKGSL